MLGLALAMISVFVDLGGWVTQVLIILGILVGLFHPIRKEIVPLGVVYLALTFSAASIGELVVIGPYVSEIASAWAAFLGPVVLTAMLLWGAAYLVTRE
jgi:4-hydroxybenzoate polyprenyltransferase